MIGPDLAARTAFVRGLFGLDVTRPWKEITVFDIAATAGVDITAVTGLSPADAADLLDDHFDRAIAKDLKGVDRTQSLRDRLFDLAMKRFEAMEPHRATLAWIETGRDGVAQASAFARAGRTARWILTLAGERVDGIDGAAMMQGLAVVITRARQAWRDDRDGDFAKTMAALDKGLRQAEDWGARLGVMRKPAE